jgi:peptide/nickel transport system ATP-binding protein
MLSIRHLTIGFETPQGMQQVVSDVSIDIGPGDMVGMAGESGSGKSMTALAIMGLLPEGARVLSGEIWYQGQNDQPAVNLLELHPEQYVYWRGTHLGLVFQNAASALNPTMRCGEQVAEVLRKHRNMDKGSARATILALFKRVELADADRLYDSYPHQISGGQQQRIMIAMAIACKPALLIADEPATALDPAAQEAVLNLLKSLCQEYHCSLLLISHDPAIVFEQCDRVVIMYKGEKVEAGRSREVQERPRHPYTRALLFCRADPTQKVHRFPDAAAVLSGDFASPRVVSAGEEAQKRRMLQRVPPLLSVRGLTVRYVTRKNFFGGCVAEIAPVRDISFQVHPRQTLGIIGPSGSGKSTLARAIAGMVPIHSGLLEWRSREGDVTLLPPAILQRDTALRREIQMVFQQPELALNPRQSIGQAIQEPMKVHGLYDTDQQRRKKALELLTEMGLDSDMALRLPHELSGGQRQRVCIARALSVAPRLLICDEVVSALDVTVQATILNLLKDIQDKFNVACLFISHDPGVIRQMCDEVIEMG